VLSAAQGDEFAGPLPKSDRPAFSYLLLGALRGWGDLNQDQQITAFEATTYTQETLHEILHSRAQRPRLDTSSPDLALASGSDTPPTIEDIAPAESEPPKQDDVVAEEESRRARAQQTQRSSIPNVATEAPPSDRTGWKITEKVGSATFVVGGGLVLAGWAYSSQSSELEDQLKKSCPTHHDCSSSLKKKYDSAQHDAKLATYLAGAGGGVMLLGAGLWALGKALKVEGIENMSLAYLPGGATVSLRGSL
jgi:hypothetical protein